VRLKQPKTKIADRFFSLVMTTKIIHSKLGQIEYSIIGQGKPIVFVNGGHSNCRETIYQKGLDVNDYCFITPSRPGYGKTPLTEINKTAKGTADLYAALLAELAISKATIVGISAGGLTAIEFAANYPEKTDSLVLMSAVTKDWLSREDKMYKGGKIIFNPKIEKYIWALYRFSFKLFPKLMTRTMFQEFSTHRPVKYTDGEVKELMNMTLTMRSGSGFVNDLDQRIDQQTLANVSCETLILHSSNDHSVDISHAHNANQKIRNSVIKVYKNRWGHLLWLGNEYDPILRDLKTHLGK
jgi:pimeloyl-ACP methyl ester carboxylesterase